MTLEFIAPQIVIKKRATSWDIYQSKIHEDQIYYNGKLLTEKLNKVYRDILIDYAAISFIKESGKISETITEENEEDYFCLKRLCYEFGLDLRDLTQIKGYEEIINRNNLAVHLMAASRITSASYDKLGFELINGLGGFKEIIDKVEENITSLQ